MEYKKLGDYISEYTQRNNNSQTIPVYSVTNSQGFCTEYFNKDVSGEDKSKYKVVPRGCFAYNPSRINVGSVDWQNCEDNVIVSPLYVIFKCSDKLNQDYLKYFLKSMEGKQMIASKLSGSVRNNLKFKELSSFEFNIGTLKEQEEIVERLKTLEQAIENEEHQIELFDELLKVRFAEIFEPYKQNDRRKLAELAEITGGLTKNSKRNSFEIKMPYLRVANVLFNRLDLEEILEIGVREAEIEKTLLREGDLLFVEGNGSIEQIGRVAVWDGSIKPILHQNHLIKARFADNTILPQFALFYFMSQEGRQQIVNKSVSTSGLNTLSVNKIGALSIPVPPIELQEKFAEFVKQVDKSKAEADLRRKLYKELLEKKISEYYMD